MLKMENDIKSEVRDWVRFARREAGLSGAELGAKLALALGTARGHSKGNISHWELGKHQPNLQQLIAISQITGIPLPPAVTGPLPSIPTELAIHRLQITDPSSDHLPAPVSKDLQWVTPEERRLLTLFRQMDSAGQAALIDRAETMQPGATVLVDALPPDIVTALRALIDSSKN